MFCTTMKKGSFGKDFLVTVPQNSEITEESHNLALAPVLVKRESGRVEKLERFADYVARQIGFKDGSECPQLSKLAHQYLMKTEDVDLRIYEYFSSEETADSLYVKLVEELERCILGYFSFHWKDVSYMISQVLNVDSQAQQKKLKEIFVEATRKQRFEKATKDLKITRVLSTIVDKMKVIGVSNSKSKAAAAMVPVDHSDRSPVLLLLGGGMGAGKSTILKNILEEPFWSVAMANAVRIEADAFKESDVLYRALSRGHHQDILPTSELVHQTSTDAASSVLVTALNDGRDVIMDGTLSWEPYVEQIIAMARNVHKHRYRMGEGYKVEDDGTITENYWEQIEEREEAKIMKPYRVELIGVTCDAFLAVVRGIRRAVQTSRAVRINSQLQSHKRFANAFRKYCQLVDNARLYCTNMIDGPPRLIAWIDQDSKHLVEIEEIKSLELLSKLNDKAESIYALYEEGSDLLQSGSVWKEIVLLPTRASLVQELKTVIAKIEMSTTKADSKNEV